MGLEKGIEHGKEHRKQYRGCKAFDRTCRNHGSDTWEEANRLYQANKAEEATKDAIEDFESEENHESI